MALNLDRLDGSLDLRWWRWQTRLISLDHFIGRLGVTYAYRARVDGWNVLGFRSNMEVFTRL
eukprot:scaffold29568_cov54-Attheya_sp.AAC.2